MTNQNEQDYNVVNAQPVAEQEIQEINEAETKSTIKDKKEKEQFSMKKEIVEWLEAIVFSLVGVVLIFTFLFRIVGVQGDSMLPTLNNSPQYQNSKTKDEEAGDRVIISHLFYKPQHGDIVVLTKPIDDNKPIIKRVIATENQTVKIDDETGAVSVDGKLLDEPYINEPIRPNNGLEATVPPGHVFVLGDNRNASLDSRASSVGMVDERYILGKAILRIFPIDYFGGLYENYPDGQ